METIYLDHNATTPTRAEAAKVVCEHLLRGLANPSSQHRRGQEARRLLEEIRTQTARLLGADLTGSHPDRLIFTSGGTEANNLAVRGIALHPKAAVSRRIIVSAMEHPSVMEPAESLLEEQWRLDAPGVDEQGIVRLNQLEEFLHQPAALVSIMLANHDVGTIQPIGLLAERCRAADVPLHTDAIQAVGKVRVHFRDLGVAALSVAAHKFQGPPGIGALLLRHDVPVAPLLRGGPQESGLRPGTESVALAAGMLKALELAEQERAEEIRRQTSLRDHFEAGLRAVLPGVVVHGEAAPRLPNTSNVAFPGIDGQVLLMALDLAGVACSVGAACSSGSAELSPTLRAMGLPGQEAASSLRFSLGATTTEAQIDEALRRILEVCRGL